MRAGVVAALASLLLISGCATTERKVVRTTIYKPSLEKPDAPPVPSGTDVVLNDGSRVSATTPEGKISVEAGPGLLRTLSWDGTTRFVVTQARPEPVYGAKGVHFEGTPTNFKPHKGITRVKFEEATRQFENVDDARIWMQIRRLHYVHTNNGLVVGWKRVPGEGKLHVEVWQFYIDGKKPTFLPDSQDYLIQLRQAPLQASKR
jgi:hypothetical protein